MHRIRTLIHIPEALTKISFRSGRQTEFHTYNSFEQPELIAFKITKLIRLYQLTMEEISQGIYIPVQGPPEIKQVNVKKGDISKILQSDFNDHVTIFGPKGRDGILIPGSALLLDDYKKLTLDDFRFLLKEPFDIEEEKKEVKKMNDVLRDLKLHGAKHTIILI
ncbi:hypothetical protein Glove_135g68 [Diversispora epigaea]|uniref:Uncharacterized protein n=1 Tax=Diversispora epigaea TaxID=1348612 RepID=A0A397IWR5_9GLOM|nr:hypothetical protein Glove_135g68 [Diversispora epigaea]